MMTVESVHRIPLRGTCIVVALDGEEPEIGSLVHRARDGAAWEIRAVDKHAIPRRPKKGDRVGLLVKPVIRGFPHDVPIKEGDTLYRIHWRMSHGG